MAASTIAAIFAVSFTVAAEAQYQDQHGVQQNYQFSPQLQFYNQPLQYDSYQRSINQGSQTNGKNEVRSITHFDFGPRSISVEVDHQSGKAYYNDGSHQSSTGSNSSPERRILTQLPNSYQYSIDPSQNSYILNYKTNEQNSYTVTNPINGQKYSLYQPGWDTSSYNLNVQYNNDYNTNRQDVQAYQPSHNFQYTNSFQPNYFVNPVLDKGYSILNDRFDRKIVGNLPYTNRHRLNDNQQFFKSYEVNDPSQPKIAHRLIYTNPSQMDKNKKHRQYENIAIQELEEFPKFEINKVTTQRTLFSNISRLYGKEQIELPIGISESSLLGHITTIKPLVLKPFKENIIKYFPVKPSLVFSHKKIPTNLYPDNFETQTTSTKKDEFAEKFNKFLKPEIDYLKPIPGEVSTNVPMGTTEEPEYNLYQSTSLPNIVYEDYESVNPLPTVLPSRGKESFKSTTSPNLSYRINVSVNPTTSPTLSYRENESINPTSPHLSYKENESINPTSPYLSYKENESINPTSPHLSYKENESINPTSFHLLYNNNESINPTTSHLSYKENVSINPTSSHLSYKENVSINPATSPTISYRENESINRAPAPTISYRESVSINPTTTSYEQQTHNYETTTERFETLYTINGLTESSIENMDFDKLVKLGDISSDDKTTKNNRYFYHDNIPTTENTNEMLIVNPFLTREPFLKKSYTTDNNNYRISNRFNNVFPTQQVYSNSRTESIPSLTPSNNDFKLLDGLNTFGKLIQNIQRNDKIASKDAQQFSTEYHNDETIWNTPVSVISQLGSTENQIQVTTEGVKKFKKVRVFKKPLVTSPYPDTVRIETAKSNLNLLSTTQNYKSTSESERLNTATESPGRSSSRHYVETPRRMNVQTTPRIRNRPTTPRVENDPSLQFIRKSEGVQSTPQSSTTIPRINNITPYIKPHNTFKINYTPTPLYFLNSLTHRSNETDQSKDANYIKINDQRILPLFTETTSPMQQTTGVRTTENRNSIFIPDPTVSVTDTNRQTTRNEKNDVQHTTPRDIFIENQKKKYNTKTLNVFEITQPHNVNEQSTISNLIKQLNSQFRNTSVTDDTTSKLFSNYFSKDNFITTMKFNEMRTTEVPSVSTDVQTNSVTKEEASMSVTELPVSVSTEEDSGQTKSSRGHVRFTTQKQLYRSSYREIPNKNEKSSNKYSQFNGRLRPIIRLNKDSEQHIIRRKVNYHAVNRSPNRQIIRKIKIKTNRNEEQKDSEVSESVQTRFVRNQYNDSNDLTLQKNAPEYRQKLKIIFGTIKPTTLSNDESINRSTDIDNNSTWSIVTTYTTEQFNVEDRTTKRYIGDITNKTDDKYTTRSEPLDYEDMLFFNLRTTNKPERVMPTVKHKQYKTFIDFLEKINNNSNVDKSTTESDDTHHSVKAEQVEPSMDPQQAVVTSLEVVTSISE